jgi:hypothetical protein
MSTIKSQHRRALGHVTLIPREGLPPIKVWRYSMSLKNFARQSATMGGAAAALWLGNKRRHGT